jgi:hypothetical protein
MPNYLFYMQMLKEGVLSPALLHHALISLKSEQDLRPYARS